MDVVADTLLPRPPPGAPPHVSSHGASHATPGPGAGHAPPSAAPQGTAPAWRGGDGAAAVHAEGDKENRKVRWGFRLDIRAQKSFSSLHDFKSEIRLY